MDVTAGDMAVEEDQNPCNNGTAISTCRSGVVHMELNQCKPLDCPPASLRAAAPLNPPDPVPKTTLLPSTISGARLATQEI